MATPIPANECSFDARAVASALGADYAGIGFTTTSIAIDSRSCQPGALFIALRGVRDGHEFVEAAARAGAVAAVVERGRSSSAVPCFEVSDTLAALGALARAHLERTRRSRPLPIIVIGGAAGKTTTKELTAAVMRSICGPTLATAGNLNNRIGVPMTIFQLDRGHQAAVIECGTNQRGEIAQLAHIVQPDAGLVLNVDIEHTEGLGTLEGVADEEAELFGTARCAVVSTAEHLLLQRVPPGLRRVTFGSDVEADVRLEAREFTDTGTQKIRLALDQRLVETGTTPEIVTSLRLSGASAASNAAAAVAAACAAINRPLRPDELSAIALALPKVQPVEGRLQLRDYNGVIVIDDTYNSNPRSLSVALASAREIADARRARLILAIGDMLELGELSREMHAKAIAEVIACRPALTIVVGDQMTAAAESIAARPKNLLIAASSDDAARRLPSLTRTGDVVLVKGSRGIAMERVVAAIAEQS